MIVATELVWQQQSLRHNKGTIRRHSLNYETRIYRTKRSVCESGGGKKIITTDTEVWQKFAPTRTPK